MLFLQGVYSYTAWRNSSVLQGFAQFLQGVHVCTAWTNSFFARFLRHKMLFLQGLHLCRAWRNGIFCTGLHGLPMPAPAHLIGSPNPLVSRAPQTLTQKRAFSGSGNSPRLEERLKAVFFPKVACVHGQTQENQDFARVASTPQKNMTQSTTSFQRVMQSFQLGPK